MNAGRAPKAIWVEAMSLFTVVAVLALCIALMTGQRSDAATAINLGTAEQFAVLAGAGVTNTGSTTIQTKDAQVRGDVGTSPTRSITGAASISWLLPAKGKLHQADGVAALAQADNLIAYNAAKGAASTEDIGAQLDGQKFLTGVYTASSALNLASNGTVTFDAQGDPGATFVIQVGSSLTMGSNSTVRLVNGAQACHVFWQVSEDATIGTNSVFVGTLLAENAIVAQNKARFNGRLLAQNASVTLDTNTFMVPSCAAVDASASTATASATASVTASATASATASTGGPTSTGRPQGGENGSSGGTPVPPNDSSGPPAGSTTTLPDTGGPWKGLLPVGLIAVLLGGGLVALAARRPRGVLKA